MKKFLLLVASGLLLCGLGYAGSPPGGNYLVGIIYKLVEQGTP